MSARAIWALVGAVVLLQISYPLVRGEGRDAIVVATVLLAAVASVAHATVTRGLAIAAAVLVGTASIGLAAEIVGVYTGFPFGSYAYTDRLGPTVAGVPLVIGLAWTMMAWPAWLVAGRLVQHTAARAVLAAWGLTAWDVFLDPQMVDAGYWHWTAVSAHLPGVATVPLTNFAGWLLVSSAVAAVLALVDRRPAAGRADGPLLAFYLWTAAGSALAHLAFLGLPASAGWGALAMGLLAVPLATVLLRTRQPA